MRKKYFPWLILGATVLIILVVLGCTVGSVWFLTLFAEQVPWGCAREIPQAEQDRREALVTEAKSWLGTQEGSQEHRQIVDLYNAHEPLAQGYQVQYDDSWCSTFVSAMAISCEYTDLIPTECGCQRHIGLLVDMGCWVEDDGYVPLPGDLIFYSSQDDGTGDCQSWSDHIGIVAGTYGRYILVVEGNYGDAVGRRVIPVNGKGIRGFGTPDYSK